MRGRKRPISSSQAGRDEAGMLADRVIHDLVRRGLIWSDDLLSPGEGL